MFADEQVAVTVSGLAAPWTYFGIPILLMPLGVFVALIQTFVFVLLSQLYLSEVAHAHDHAEETHDATDVVHGRTGEQVAHATA
jgi:hypothetical protein